MKAGDIIIYSDRDGKRTATVLHVTKSGLIAIQRDEQIIYRKPEHVRRDD